MKKAQSLAIAFIGVMTILIIFIGLYVDEHQKILAQDPNILREIGKEGDRIGKQLVGPASPSKWGSTENIKKLGLSKNGTISNQTLSVFSNISYSKTKLLLATNTDFILFFKDYNKTIKAGDREYWGYTFNNSNGGNNLTKAINITNQQVNLIKRERSIVYEDNRTRIVKMIIYVWD